MKLQYTQAKIVFFWPLLSCAATQPDLKIDACIEKQNKSLIVAVKNVSESSVRVATDNPHLGCCAKDETSIYLSDTTGKELKRCAFVDQFQKPIFFQLGQGKVVTYSLSSDSVQSFYCGADLVGLTLSVKYTTDQRMVGDPEVSGEASIEICKPDIK